MRAWGLLLPLCLHACVTITAPPGSLPAASGASPLAVAPSAGAPAASGLLTSTARAAAPPSYTWKVEGWGALPIVTALAPTVPPPIIDPPPVVELPPPSTDNTPFVWPPQPVCQGNPVDARYTAIGRDPKPSLDFGTYYKALSHYCNPLPGSHAYACMHDGQRIWAPTAGTPATIRTACATGHT